MAIAPLQIPQLGAVSGGMDFAPLANLGNVYKQAQQDQQKREALSALASGDPSKLDIRPLLASGDMSLTQLGINLRNRDQDLQRQGERDKVGDQHWAASYDLQKRTAARADDKTPAGFESGPDGGYRPIPGGPADPNYLKTRQQATEPGLDATAAQRAAVARQYGVDPASPQGRAFILSGKLPEADTTFSASVEQRKAAAQANGLAPDSPGYQSFVLTGKMPKEDAQPLTATDKKAILEADEKVQGGQQVIQNLQKAKSLSKQAFAGPMADKRGYAASFLGETSDLGKSGIATTDLNNLVTSNALQQLKTIFGGNPTEGERAILLDIQGSANQPDAVRQKIYDRAMEAANKRLQFEQQRADEIRGGSFYKPTGGTSKGSTQPTSANGVPSPPQVGEVRSGYRFKGGNPGDPASWVQVAQ